MESVLEISTAPCANTAAGRRAAARAARARCAATAAGRGLTIGSAGTHPFAMWEDQRIVARPRYRELVTRAALRRAPGAHLRHARARRPRRPRQGHPRGQRHAGPPRGAPGADRQLALLARRRHRACSRRARRSSAPSRASASRRTTATGRTTSARSRSWSSRGVIEDYTYLWYDVRPHPKFGTVEVRVMDSQTRVEHTLALAALVQAMVKELCEHFDAGRHARRLPVADARREQVAGRPARPRRRARRPALQRARGDQGAGAPAAGPPARARPGPGLGRRARGDRRPAASAATAPSARWSSTRPTTTCARSWPRSWRRRRPTEPG